MHGIALKQLLNFIFKHFKQSTHWTKNNSTSFLNRPAILSPLDTHTSDRACSAAFKVQSSSPFTRFVESAAFSKSASSKVKTNQPSHLLCVCANFAPESVFMTVRKWMKKQPHYKAHRKWRGRIFLAFAHILAETDSISVYVTSSKSSS